jgi:hypothetical protein
LKKKRRRKRILECESKRKVRKTSIKVYKKGRERQGKREREKETERG